MARFGTLGQQYFDDSGDPLSGGTLTFYETGTTTFADTYSDPALTTLNTNPVVLDGAGRIGDVFFSGELKVVIKDASGVTIETRDPVGGGLDTRDTWTSARAANLDNLDDSVSSRAPASTALTDVTWTDARAAKLDNLDQSISSLNTSPISSVQRGSVTLNSFASVATANVTLAPVDMAKSMVTVSFHVSSSGMNFNSVSARLTSSTNLRIEGYDDGSSAYVYWEVIEYV